VVLRAFYGDIDPEQALVLVKPTVIMTAGDVLSFVLTDDPEVALWLRSANHVTHDLPMQGRIKISDPPDDFALIEHTHDCTKPNRWRNLIRLARTANRAGSRARTRSRRWSGLAPRPGMGVDRRFDAIEPSLCVRV